MKKFVFLCDEATLTLSASDQETAWDTLAELVKNPDHWQLEEADED